MRNRKKGFLKSFLNPGFYLFRLNKNYIFKSNSEFFQIYLSTCISVSVILRYFIRGGHFIDISDICFTHLTKSAYIKKRNYNTNLKVNLEEMCSNNPKDYWGFWKRLQRQNLSESTIELYQFYNCFLKQSEPPGKTQIQNSKL